MRYLWGVRFTAIILAIYTLVLACYPCMDRGACVDEPVSGAAQTLLTEHHTPNSDEQDHCSPLCICSCCAASVQLATSVIVIPVLVSHHTEFIVPYQQRALLNGIHTIWQPPRLAWFSFTDDVQSFVIYTSIINFWQRMAMCGCIVFIAIPASQSVCPIPIIFNLC